jgi:zinc transporter
LTPGSMTAGSMTAGVMPGLVWAFRMHADGTPEALPVDAPIDMHHEGWLWLHFNLADARACTLLSGFDGFSSAAAATLVAPDEQPQLYVEDECVYGVFADRIYDLDGATEEIGYLHFAMTERLLISARRHAMTAAESTRRALLGGHKLTSVAALLEMIVSHVIQSIDRYADQLADEMDDIEEELLGRELSDQRQRLARGRKGAIHLHRQIQGLHTLFRRVAEELDSEETRPYLRLSADALVQRLEELDRYIVAMRERAHLLQEEMTTRIAEETNRSLHFLTVITTYFLPASLVAGIFGMNTKGLPFTEYSNGFFWAMVILVFSPAVVFLVLWRLRIVGRR